MGQTQGVDAYEDDVRTSSDGSKEKDALDLGTYSCRKSVRNFRRRGLNEHYCHLSHSAQNVHEDANHRTNEGDAAETHSAHGEDFAEMVH